MKSNYGLVSIVVSVFNGESFINDSIDSLINQTYRDIEIIIIDDGSTDRTAEILTNYIKLDKRVRVYTQNNQGLSVALNRAVDEANGVWVARMDADDISAKDRIFKQLDFLMSNGLDFCGSAVETIGTVKKRIWKYPVTHNEILVRMFFNSPFAHPTVIGRASIFKEYKYKESGVPAEDYELWERLISSGRFLFGNCPDVLLFYRIHPKQISTEKVGKQQLMRSDIAKAYWKKNLFCCNFESVVRFKDEVEFKNAESYFSGKYGNNYLDLIADSLANMAIRSKSAGWPFFKLFIFSNTYFKYVSAVKKIALIAVAILPEKYAASLMNIWFKNR